METLSFLTVDNQPISIEQAVKYLQASGKLTQVIGDIIRQYIIEQEISTREDIDISSALIEQKEKWYRLRYISRICCL